MRTFYDSEPLARQGEGETLLDKLAHWASAKHRREISRAEERLPNGFSKLWMARLGEADRRRLGATRGIDNEPCEDAPLELGSTQWRRVEWRGIPRTRRHRFLNE